MSAFADEKYLSRRGGTGDFSWEERDFIVRGSDDPQEIDAAALANDNAPATISHTDGTLYRTGIRNRQQDANGIWTVTIGYESNELELAVGQKRHRWSNVGGTRHVLNARAHVATYDADGNPTTTPQDGLLGWDGKTVNGADIVDPAFFEFEVDIALSDISGLKETVKSLKGKLNDAEFYGDAAGEVLFLGATRSDRGNGIKDITFYFAAGDHLEDVEVGPVTIDDVDAWDVVSVATDDAGEVTSVAVDKAYLSGNFALLGVGTSE